MLPLLTVASLLARDWHRLRLTRGGMMLMTILLIVLILALLGAVPAWPYSRDWGYAPSGVVGLALVIVLVLALTGRV